MEIITAKTAGFCFGVERALNTVYEEIEKSDKPVYTFGPIVHNALVTKDLESKGVCAIDESDLDKTSKEDATVIIRAHGVSDDICRRLKDAYANVVDATCPFVKKIHRIVGDAAKEGRRVVIVGDPKHPEVIGIKGRAAEDAVVIQDMGDFINAKIPEKTGLTLVAQTTFNYEKFKEIIAQLQNMNYDIKCFNTVCSATQERQEETFDIASHVDAMIVIGDVASSNTQKLVEICSERCSRTIFIRSLDDLKLENLHSVYKVGITAGASTPKHLIEEVQNYVRSEF